MTKNKSLRNTGFDDKTANVSGRLVNDKGNFNVIKTGISFFDRLSLFHTLLEIKFSHFLLGALLLFVIVNLIFATLYSLVGAPHFSGVNGTTQLEQFFELFFFSSQTLTTVGYGSISPQGFWASAIAAIESFIGLFVFALLTGLLYGRFSRPKANFMFSDVLLVSPFKENSKAIMCRLINHKNNNYTAVQAEAIFAIFDEAKGRYDYFPANLEISTIGSLALNWTLVHELTEDSPVYNFSSEDFKKKKVELMVLVKAYDEHYSNLVQQRKSYIYSDLVAGKFNLMFHPSDDLKATVLEVDKINSYTPLSA